MQNPDVYEPLPWVTTPPNPNQNYSPISTLQLTNSLNLSRTFHQFVLSLQTPNSSSPQSSVLPGLTHGTTQNEQPNDELILHKKSEEPVDEPLFFTCKLIRCCCDRCCSSTSTVEI